VRRLRAGGLADVGDASVYGTLRRLYRGGALTSYVVPSDEGPHRRYYGITETGKTQLSEARTTWAEFVRAVDALLEQTEAEVPA
jgi:PadR family transcriptional regulator PadR